MPKSKKARAQVTALKQSENVVTRDIDGKTILMPLCKSSKDINYLYTLNESASFAWGLLDGKSTLAEIRDQITGTYHVASGKVKAELTEFIKDLKSFKAVASTAVLSRAQAGKNKTAVLTPSKRKLKWIPLQIFRVKLDPSQAVLSCCDASGRGMGSYRTGFSYQCVGSPAFCGTVTKGAVAS